jgi:hypothetical protein
MLKMVSCSPELVKTRDSNSFHHCSIDIGTFWCYVVLQLTSVSLSVNRNNGFHVCPPPPNRGMWGLGTRLATQLDLSAVSTYFGNVLVRNWPTRVSKLGWGGGSPAGTKVSFGVSEACFLELGRGIFAEHSARLHLTVSSKYWPMILSVKYHLTPSHVGVVLPVWIFIWPVTRVVSSQLVRWRIAPSLIITHGMRFSWLRNRSHNSTQPSMS